MKILHITDFLPDCHKLWGGAEQACLRLLHLLSKKGFDINVVSTKPLRRPLHPYNFFFVDTLEDYLPYKLRQIYRRIRTLLPIDLVVLIQFYRLISKAKPDIIHAHNFKILTLSIIWVAKIFKIPVVVSIYDYWYFCQKEILLDKEGKICFRFNGASCRSCFSVASYFKCIFILRKKIFNFFLKKIDKYIVLSKSSAGILQRYGIEKEKIAIIYQPFPFKKTPSEQTNLDLELENPFLLLVGGFTPQKGLHVAIESLALTKREIPNIKLCVVGATEGVKESYVHTITQMVHQLKLETSIFFLGLQSPANLYHILKKADIVIVPEQWPNMSPIILIEAMTLGRPVLASKIGGIPEFIKDGENGLLVNPNEPKEFAEKIIWLLKNPQEVNKLTKEARVHAYKIWDDEMNSKKVIQLYESLLKL